MIQRVLLFAVFAVIVVICYQLYFTADDNIQQIRAYSAQPQVAQQNPVATQSIAFPGKSHEQDEQVALSSPTLLFEEQNLDPANYHRFQLESLEKAQSGQRVTPRELSDLLSFLVDREFNRKACIHPKSDFLQTETYRVLEQRNHSLEHWREMTENAEPTAKVGALLMLANLYRKANWLEEFEAVSLQVLPFLESRSQRVVLEKVAKTFLIHAQMSGDNALEERAATYLFVLFRDYDQLDDDLRQHEDVIHRSDMSAMLARLEHLQTALTDLSWQQPNDKKISAIPINRPLTDEQKECLAKSY